MIKSISTSTFYNRPIEEALSIIKESGFQYIELTIYWKGDKWETAQHLRDVSPKKVINLIEDNGLKIATIHDTGGLVHKDTKQILSDKLLEYLQLVNYDIETVVVHSPFMRDPNLWAKFKKNYLQELTHLAKKTTVSIENMSRLPDFFVPLMDLAHLYDYAKTNKFFINIDTSHCGESRIDLLDAKKRYGDLFKTVHLSDYRSKKFVQLGKGDLPLENFIKVLDKDTTRVLTVECNADQNLSNRELVEYIKELFNFVSTTTLRVAPFAQDEVVRVQSEVA